MEDMLHDLDIIKSAEELGLFLNNSKLEIICHDVKTRETLTRALLVAVVAGW